MTGPIVTVTIDCSALELDDIVITGSRGPGWWLRPGYQLPGLDPQTKDVDAAFMHGTPTTSFKWVDGFISGDITFEAASAADRAAAVAAMRPALGRTSFPVITNWNGDIQQWRARPGRFMPSTLDYVDVRDDQVTYALSIRVHPISTTGGP